MNFPKAKSNPLPANELRCLRLAHSVPIKGQTFREHWSFVYPVLSLVPGPQSTIDGRIVHCNGGGLWAGTRHLPDFDTRDQALEYAASHDLDIHLIDID